MKKILIEAQSEEELRLIEAFIKDHKMKGFHVEDAKADKTGVFDDVVRMLIPIL